MVHYGQIPDETDGAEGHEGEPCERDPQRDQGWKPVDKLKQVETFKVLKMYAWEQPFMEMIGDIRQDPISHNYHRARRSPS